LTARQRLNLDRNRPVRRQNARAGTFSGDVTLRQQQRTFGEMDRRAPEIGRIHCHSEKSVAYMLRSAGGTMKTWVAWVAP
jgi:hypothetical protein